MNLLKGLIIGWLINVPNCICSQNTLSIPRKVQSAYHFDIEFSYSLNKDSHIRTGEFDMGNKLVFKL